MTVIKHSYSKTCSCSLYVVSLAASFSGKNWCCHTCTHYESYSWIWQKQTSLHNTYMTEKYFTFFLISVLWHVWSPPSNILIPTCWNFDLYLHVKNELHSELPFTDFVKILQNCYSEYLDNAWSWPSTMTVSPYMKLWCPMCWNQLVGNFNAYLHAKNQLHL